MARSIVPPLSSRWIAGASVAAQILRPSLIGRSVAAIRATGACTSACQRGAQATVREASSAAGARAFIRTIGTASAEAIACRTSVLGVAPATVCRPGESLSVATPSAIFGAASWPWTRGFDPSATENDRERASPHSSVILPARRSQTIEIGAEDSRMGRVPWMTVPSNKDTRPSSRWAAAATIRRPETSAGPEVKMAVRFPLTRTAFDARGSSRKSKDPAALSA